MGSVTSISHSFLGAVSQGTETTNTEKITEGSRTFTVTIYVTCKEMLLSELQAPIGCDIDSHRIEELLARIGKQSTKPVVKSFTDITYHDYLELGLTLQFKVEGGGDGKDATSRHDKRKLDCFDIYNALFRPDLPPFPSLPIIVSMLEIGQHTVGSDFVQALGEPSRKGGGTGLTSGSINIWCEWGALGLMVEFGGQGLKGPLAWDAGKDAIWKVITIFQPEPTGV
jgi:hypothetical protein